MPAGVEGLDEQRRRGALADRSVGAEHRDAGAGDVEDPAGEQVEVLRVLRVGARR